MSASPSAQVSLAPPRRCSPGLVALYAVLALLALQVLPLAPLFEYRRELLAAQPWRWLTGHWVHLSWQHLGINLLALVLVVAFFAPCLSRRDLIGIVLGANLSISLALFFVWPTIDWYRGWSGTLNALYVAGCVVWLGSPTPPGRAVSRWWALPLLAAVVVKILGERAWTNELPPAWFGAPIAPQVHLAGAVFGVLAGLVILGLRRC